MTKSSQVNYLINYFDDFCHKQKSVITKFMPQVHNKKKGELILKRIGWF
jgi:hypothetical protein